MTKIVVNYYKMLNYLINNKKITAIVLLAVIFVLSDRFLKFLAVEGYFEPSKKIISNLFSLNFIKNPYISFSLPVGGWGLNVAIALLICALCSYALYYIRQKNFFVSIMLFAMLLGAISNFVDRLKYGYVIDYFDLKFFTVFNLADAMIVLSAIGLAGALFLEEKKKNIQ